MPESYTGNEGNKAIAAGLDVMDGGENWAGVNGGWRAINKTRDMIAERTSAVLPVEKGGTGATTVAGARNALGLGNTAGALPIANGGTGATAAPAARAALGAVASADVAPPGSAAANAIARYSAAGRLQAVDPASGNDVATLNSINGRVAKTGDTMTGDLFLPNSSPASSGYTIAYINSDGRVSRGASSEVYKTNITPIDPMTLGNIFPQLHTFAMKDDPDLTQLVGHIAERLNESDDLRRFVIYKREIEYEDVLGDVTEDVFDESGEYVETIVTGQRVVERRSIGTRLARDENGNPIPDSIDFIGLLLAQVAQLNARVKELEGDPNE